MSDTTDATTTPADDGIRVVDNPARSRYEARLGERVLGVVDYRLEPDGGIVLVHTEVQPDAEGMGVGSRLAKGALENVRARGLKLTVVCPFITAYLKRHRGDYEDLLAR
ncbi:MAG TPA: GNAT family N-acetyltransferase [Candidatus Limnocylindrales bacterium]